MIPIRPKRSRVFPAVVALAWAFFLPQCHLQSGDNGEGFLAVELHDSLSLFDSVTIRIFADGDTGRIVEKVWNGPLADPGSIPVVRIGEGETRALAVRVQAYDEGSVVMDMILSKRDGRQIVNRLPLADGPEQDSSGNYALAWKHKALIRIDLQSLALPADVQLEHFPLLVKLDKSRFDFSQAADSGRDIRFATLDGRPVPFEVAEWDDSAGRAVIWVRVDTLMGQASTLHMFWGNPDAEPASAPERVFEPEAGYSGVWHLGEKGAGNAGEFRDATGRFHATGGSPGLSLPPVRIPGELGYSQDFQHTDSQTAVILPETFDPGADAWTFSAWIRRDGKAGGVLFRKSDGEASVQRFQIDCEAASGRNLAVQRDGDAYQSRVVLEEGVFMLVAVTYDGKTASIYANGFLRESQAWTQGPDALATAVLGSTNQAGGKGFHGAMNEVWFSSRVRSAAYLRMQYENQVTWSNLVTVVPL